MNKSRDSQPRSANDDAFDVLHEEMMRQLRKPPRDTGLMWLALMCAAFFGLCGFLVWYQTSNLRADRDACLAMRCPDGAQHLVESGRCLCTAEAQP